MTTDRQQKAKPTPERGHSGGWLAVAGWALLRGAVLGLVMATFHHADEIRDLEERIAALEELTSGCQQGVSAPGCGPDGCEAVPQVQEFQGVSQHGPLAQSVEQRTFNPLPTCTPGQPKAKLRGNPAVFDARSASGSSGVYADRVSGGRQEVRP